MVPLAIVGGIVALFIVVFAVMSASGSGTCKGGVALDAAAYATWTSSDNHHWTATVSCVGGGSKTLHRTGKDPFG